MKLNLYKKFNYRFLSTYKSLRLVHISLFREKKCVFIFDNNERPKK